MCLALDKSGQINKCKCKSFILIKDFKLKVHLACILYPLNVHMTMSHDHCNYII